MKRTTHRSSKGTKLYAKRTTAGKKAGRFVDIQTHKRASAADQRKRSKDEGTWLLWGVIDRASGQVFTLRRTRSVASRICVSQPGCKVVRVRVEAGVPDPMRKRK